MVHPALKRKRSDVLEQARTPRALYYVSIPRHAYTRQILSSNKTIPLSDSDASVPLSSIFSNPMSTEGSQVRVEDHDDVDACRSHFTPSDSDISIPLSSISSNSMSTDAQLRVEDCDVDASRSRFISNQRHYKLQETPTTRFHLASHSTMTSPTKSRPPFPPNNPVMAPSTQNPFSIKYSPYPSPAQQRYLFHRVPLSLPNFQNPVPLSTQAPCPSSSRLRPAHSNAVTQKPCVSEDSPLFKGANIDVTPKPKSLKKLLGRLKHLSVMSSPESPHADWATPPLVAWQLTRHQVDLSEGRVQMLYHANRNPEPHDLTFPYPPPALLYPNNSVIRVYNWFLMRDLCFNQEEPGYKLAKTIGNQSHKRWRGILSNTFTKKDEKAVHLSAVGIEAAKRVPESFSLRWRGLIISSHAALASPMLLKPLVWELNEIAFLTSLLTIDQRMSKRFSDDPIYLRFFTEWHGLPSICPRFEGPRPCECVGDAAWQTRRGYIGALIDITSSWVDFPSSLLDWAAFDQKKFLQAENAILCFVQQTYADMFFKHMPLPYLRPVFPSQEDLS
ncbi:hypothetical protein M422DRAFT_23463 [Sphaerobolus stellatus SS14]|nr:hypothetical protein M422DRAFT_23463 [Sphaerobolus stellatus SS14]